MAKRLTDIRKTPKARPASASAAATFTVPAQPAQETAKDSSAKLNKIPKQSHSSGRRIMWWRWLLVLVLLIVIGFVVVALGGGVIGGVLQYRKLTTTQQVDYTADQLAEQAKKAKEEGDLSTAEKSYEMAIKKETKLDYEVQLSLVKYRLKKYEEAINMFRSILPRSTEPAFIWNGIGNMYRDWAYSESARRSERLIEAETAYRSSFGTDTRYLAAYSNLALMLEENREYDKAIKVAEIGLVATKSKELQVMLDRLKMEKAASNATK